MSEVYLQKKTSDSPIDLSQLAFKIESGVYTDYDSTVNTNGGFVTHNYVKFADGTQIEYGYANSFKNGSDLKLQLKYVGWALPFLTPYYSTKALHIQWYDEYPNEDNSKIMIASLDESTPIGNPIAFNYLVIGRWK